MVYVCMWALVKRRWTMNETRNEQRWNIQTGMDLQPSTQFIQRKKKTRKEKQINKQTVRYRWCGLSENLAKINLVIRFGLCPTTNGVKCVFDIEPDIGSALKWIFNSYNPKFRGALRVSIISFRFNKKHPKKKSHEFLQESAAV